MLSFLTLADSPEERALLEQLYYAHRSDMFALAMSYLKNEYDAEDAVQTVFCDAAQRHMGVLMERGADSRRRFLLLAVKHRSIDTLRKRGGLVYMEDSDPDAAVPADGDFVEDICANAEKEQLESAIKSLDPIYRDALWLRFSLELTAKEIASSLGVNESTVIKRLQRGKQKLLSLLASEGGAA